MINAGIKKRDRQINKYVSKNNGVKINDKENKLKTENNKKINI